VAKSYGFQRNNRNDWLGSKRVYYNLLDVSALVEYFVLGAEQLDPTQNFNTKTMSDKQWNRGSQLWL